jgi:hypothetical protein
MTVVMVLTKAIVVQMWHPTVTALVVIPAIGSAGQVSAYRRVIDVTGATIVSTIQMKYSAHLLINAKGGPILVVSHKSGLMSSLSNNP